MSDYKVQELLPDEVAAFKQAQSGVPSYRGRAMPESHRRIVAAPGYDLKGSFSLTARDSESGEVAWEHAQDNLITDYGRMAFWLNNWGNMCFGFCPSKETPNIGRECLPTDVSQVLFTTNQLGFGSVTPSTYTKQWSLTFGTPAVTRTLGTIFLTAWNVTPDANIGPYAMYAYSLLTPAKTQTTTQTLEVVYKLSMNPIW